MRLFARQPGPSAEAAFSAPYPFAVCDLEPGRFAPEPWRKVTGTRGLAAWFAVRLTGDRRA